MFLLDVLTSLEKNEIFFNIVQSIATSLALIIGGIWAYFKFIRQRENKALIDFTVDLNIIARKGNWMIVEVIAYVENKGKVQHKITDFNFELVSLNKNDEITLSDKYGNQAHLPNEVATGSFLPRSYKYLFIEPGLRNKYSFVTRVSIEAEVLMLHGMFVYADGKRFHKAEITMKVPEVE